MTLVLLADTEREPLLEHVEWGTLLFFAALFVLMHISCTVSKSLGSLSGLEMLWLRSLKRYVVALCIGYQGSRNT